MSEPLRPGRVPSLAFVCLVVAVQSGCTSALTTAYLREGLWRGAEHAASPEPAAEGTDEPAPDPDAAATRPDSVADRDRREAAKEEAMSRLSRLGALDPAVETALVATLQRTEPEDWPVVVDEFAASLATADAKISVTPPGDAVAEGVRDAEPAAEPGASPAAADGNGPESADAEPMTDAAPATASSEIPAGDTEPPPAAAAPPAVAPAAEPPLAVRKACFASAVRAWGDVDRYPADRFRPGEEVIVYVELDNLAASASPAGHTTCIDAVLRLVDESDHTLHTWTFDPIAETGPDRRRDYFARYVVRIPESIPSGGCRVQMAVTDTLAGETVGTSLPLEIAAAE